MKRLNNLVVKTKRKEIKSNFDEHFSRKLFSFFLKLRDLSTRVSSGNFVNKKFEIDLN